MISGKYDVVGDIHGHAEVLCRLLREMGYRDNGDVFRHPDRRVIFVGDFIDRGPDQRNVLRIAKRMCDVGTALAVMGNHEFNALGWAEPDGNGDFLRPHTTKNAEQHEQFLSQLGEARRLTLKRSNGFGPCQFGWICRDCGWFTPVGIYLLSRSFGHT